MANEERKSERVERAERPTGTMRVKHHKSASSYTIVKEKAGTPKDLVFSVDAGKVQDVPEKIGRDLLKLTFPLHTDDGKIGDVPLFERVDEASPA